jgi:thiamine pyrophosphokinase
LHPDENASTTDLAKAVSFALARGATTVDVVGAGGGRADHALANLSLLTAHRGRAPIRFHDDRFSISLVDGFASIDAPPGTVVSLVAIGACAGVTTTGLRWPLSDFTLEFGPRGVHNEVVSSPAGVSVTSGDLLLFLGRWIEKHG